jgi:hypothetical protein
MWGGQGRYKVYSAADDNDGIKYVILLVICVLVNETLPSLDIHKFFIQLAAHNFLFVIFVN